MRNLFKFKIPGFKVKPQIDQTEAVDLRAKIDALQPQLETLQNQCSELCAQLESATARQLEIKSKVTDLQDKLKEGRARIAELEEEPFGKPGESKSYC